MLDIELARAESGKDGGEEEEEETVAFVIRCS